MLCFAGGDFAPLIFFLFSRDIMRAISSQRVDASHWLAASSPMAVGRNERHFAPGVGHYSAGGAKWACDLWCRSCDNSHSYNRSAKFPQRILRICSLPGWELCRRCPKVSPLRFGHLRFFPEDFEGAHNSPPKFCASSIVDRFCRPILSTSAQQERSPEGIRAFYDSDYQ
jgi:hypothetical protein